GAEIAEPALPVFSADGKTVYAPGRGEAVRAFDLSTGKESRAAELDSAALSGVFSPDGPRLACGAGHKAPRAIRVRDLAGRREVRRFVRPDGAFQFDPLVFSQEGSLLAMKGHGCATAFVTVRDVRDGTERLALDERHLLPQAGAFSPDG